MERCFKTYTEHMLVQCAKSASSGIWACKEVPKLHGFKEMFLDCGEFLPWRSFRVQNCDVSCPAHHCCPPCHAATCEAGNFCMCGKELPWLWGALPCHLRESVLWSYKCSDVWLRWVMPAIASHRGTCSDLAYCWYDASQPKERTKSCFLFWKAPSNPAG